MGCQYGDIWSKQMYIGAFMVWWLIVKGTYRQVEKIFLFACTICFTYAVSAYMAHPPWGTILTNTITPSF
jgi:Mn2+/Fe2+ NRAMP family transporter